MSTIIRYATIEDALQILDIYRPIVEQFPISFETEVPTQGKIRERINNAKLWLVCEIDGIIAGYAYASSHRTRAAYQWAVDVSVYVHEDYRKRHIGKALYTSLFALLKEQGYFNAYAGIALPNPASVRLHESMGFTPIGVYQKVGYKLGQWHDVGWWHLTLSDPTGNPQPPGQALSEQAVDTAIIDGLALIRSNVVL